MKSSSIAARTHLFLIGFIGGAEMPKNRSSKAVEL